MGKPVCLAKAGDPWRGLYMENKKILEFIQEYIYIIDLAIADSPTDIQENISDEGEKLKSSELAVLAEELREAIPALGFIPLAGLPEEERNFITPIYLMKYKANNGQSRFWKYLEIMKREPNLESMTDSVATEVNDKINLVENGQKYLKRLIKVPFLAVASTQPEIFKKYFPN